MKHQNRILEILRVIIGIVFILGAVLKLFSTTSFEILLVKISFLNWYWAAIITRIIISFEFLLGIFIVSKVYIKQTLKISLFTLIIFSILLLYLKIFLQYNDNCGCFGSIIKLRPIESIIKNIVLIAFIVILLKKYLFVYSEVKIIRVRIIAFLIFLISFLIPHIVSPINLSENAENYVIKPHQFIKSKELTNVKFSNKETINLLQGKKVICFLSLTCKVCRYTASKLAIINRRHNNSLPIYIIFLKSDKNNEKLVSEFYSETDASNIPYTLFEPNKFFRISDKRIPFIMILDNGEIKDLSNYTDLYPDKILKELL